MAKRICKPIVEKTETVTITTNTKRCPFCHSMEVILYATKPHSCSKCNTQFDPKEVVGKMKCVTKGMKGNKSREVIRDGVNKGKVKIQSQMFCKRSKWDAIADTIKQELKKNGY